MCQFPERSADNFLCTFSYIKRPFSQLNEDMDLSVTDARRTPRTPDFWQGAISHIWASQPGEHWGLSQSVKVCTLFYVLDVLARDEVQIVKGKDISFSRGSLERVPQVWVCAT